MRLSLHVLFSVGVRLGLSHEGKNIEGVSEQGAEENIYT